MDSISDDNLNTSKIDTLDRFVNNLEKFYNSDLEYGEAFNDSNLDFKKAEIFYLETHTTSNQLKNVNYDSTMEKRHSKFPGLSSLTVVTKTGFLSYTRDLMLAYMKSYKIEELKKEKVPLNTFHLTQRATVSSKKHSGGHTNEKPKNYNESSNLEISRNNFVDEKESPNISISKDKDDTKVNEVNQNKKNPTQQPESFEQDLNLKEKAISSSQEFFNYSHSNNQNDYNSNTQNSTSAFWHRVEIFNPPDPLIIRKTQEEIITLIRNSSNCSLPLDSIISEYCKVFNKFLNPVILGFTDMMEFVESTYPSIYIRRVKGPSSTNKSSQYEGAGKNDNKSPLNEIRFNAKYHCEMKSVQEYCLIHSLMNIISTYSSSIIQSKSQINQKRMFPLSRIPMEWKKRYGNKLSLNLLLSACKITNLKLYFQTLPGVEILTLPHDMMVRVSRGINIPEDFCAIYVFQSLSSPNKTKPNIDRPNPLMDIKQIHINYNEFSKHKIDPSNNTHGDSKIMGIEKNQALETPSTVETNPSPIYKFPQARNENNTRRLQNLTSCTEQPPPHTSKTPNSQQQDHQFYTYHKNHYPSGIANSTKTKASPSETVLQLKKPYEKPIFINSSNIPTKNLYTNRNNSTLTNQQSKHQFSASSKSTQTHSYQHESNKTNPKTFFKASSNTVTYDLHKKIFKLIALVCENQRHRWAKGEDLVEIEAIENELESKNQSVDAFCGDCISHQARISIPETHFNGFNFPQASEGGNLRNNLHVTDAKNTANPLKNTMTNEKEYWSDGNNCELDPRVLKRRDKKEKRRRRRANIRELDTMLNQKETFNDTETNLPGEKTNTQKSSASLPAAITYQEQSKNNSETHDVNECGEMPSSEIFKFLPQISSFSNQKLMERRLLHRVETVGMLVSSIKSDWPRFLEEEPPLTVYMQAMGVKKLKLILQEVPNLIIHGLGGNIRVCTVTHATMCNHELPKEQSLYVWSLKPHMATPLSLFPDFQVDNYIKKSSLQNINSIESHQKTKLNENVTQNSVESNKSSDYEQIDSENKILDDSKSVAEDTKIESLKGFTENEKIDMLREDDEERASLTIQVMIETTLDHNNMIDESTTRNWEQIAAIEDRSPSQESFYTDHERNGEEYELNFLTNLKEENFVQAETPSIIKNNVQEAPHQPDPVNNFDSNNEDPNLIQNYRFHTLRLMFVLISKFCDNFRKRFSNQNHKTSSGSSQPTSEEKLGLRISDIPKEWEEMYCFPLEPLMKKANYEKIEDLVRSVKGVLIFGGDNDKRCICATSDRQSHGSTSAARKTHFTQAKNKPKVTSVQPPPNLVQKNLIPNYNTLGIIHTSDETPDDFIPSQSITNEANYQSNTQNPVNPHTKAFIKAMNIFKKASAAQLEAIQNLATVCLQSQTEELVNNNSKIIENSSNSTFQTQLNSSISPRQLYPEPVHPDFMQVHSNLTQDPSTQKSSTDQYMTPSLPINYKKNNPQQLSTKQIITSPPAQTQQNIFSYSRTNTKPYRHSEFPYFSQNLNTGLPPIDSPNSYRYFPKNPKNQKHFPKYISQK